MDKTLFALSVSLASIVTILAAPVAAQPEPRVAEYVGTGSSSVCNQVSGLAHRTERPSTGGCTFVMYDGDARVVMQDWASESVAFTWTLWDVGGGVCAEGTAIDEATIAASGGCAYLTVMPTIRATMGRVFLI